MTIVNRAGIRQRAQVRGLVGASIIRVSWWATAMFTVVTAVCVADPGRLEAVAFVVDSALFAAGLVVFTLAFVAGAARSRTHELGVGGWFFLAGAAPRPVQWHLLGALAVQAAVGFAGAAAHPDTALIFGTLVPTLGLGCCGLWGGRHGSFGPRVVDRPEMVPRSDRPGSNAPGTGERAPEGPGRQE